MLSLICQRCNHSYKTLQLKALSWLSLCFALFEQPLPSVYIYSVTLKDMVVTDFHPNLSLPTWQCSQEQLVQPSVLGWVKTMILVSLET